MGEFLTALITSVITTFVINIIYKQFESYRRMKIDIIESHVLYCNAFGYENMPESQINHINAGKIKFRKLAGQAEAFSYLYFFKIVGLKSDLLAISQDLIKMSNHIGREQESYNEGFESIKKRVLLAFL